MKNKIYSLIGALAFVAHGALAADPAATDPTAKYTLPNPLGINTVPELVNNVINGILGVVGAIALLYMVWGGITWMTSRGNAESIKKGKDTIVWGILGLAMIFSSYVIVSFVVTIMAGQS